MGGILMKMTMSVSVVEVSIWGLVLVGRPSL